MAVQFYGNITDAVGYDLEDRTDGNPKGGHPPRIPSTRLTSVPAVPVSNADL